MQQRTRLTLLVVLCFALMAGLSAFTLTPHPSTPSTSVVALTPALAVMPATEMMGGCREAALDHGHDVDPTAFVDQENDECIAGSHVARSRDGSALQH